MAYASVYVSLPTQPPTRNIAPTESHDLGLGHELKLGQRCALAAARSPHRGREGFGWCDNHRSLMAQAIASADFSLD